MLPFISPIRYSSIASSTVETWLIRDINKHNNTLITKTSFIKNEAEESDRQLISCKLDERPFRNNFSHVVLIPYESEVHPK
jgi:hypothetical protein